MKSIGLAIPYVRSPLVALMCASMLMNGCATQSVRDREAHSWRAVTSATAFPVERLAAVPRVITDTQPADFSGFWTRDQIAAAEARRSQLRSATISEYSDKYTVDNPARIFFEGSCVSFKDPLEFMVSFVLCPFIRVGAFAVILVYNVGATVTGGTVGSLKPLKDAPVPPAAATRLTVLMTEHARVLDLQSEVSKKIPGAPNHGAFPHLLVRIESVMLLGLHDDERYYLQVRARSRAVAAASGAPQQSLHWVDSPKRKLDDWVASEGKLLREDLGAAIDALSTSVVTVHVRALDEPNLTEQQLAELRRRTSEVKAAVEEEEHAAAARLEEEKHAAAAKLEEEKRAAALKQEMDRFVAALHRVGFVEADDVLPAGELIVDKDFFYIPKPLPPLKGGWLIVNLTKPTGKGGRSYKVRSEVNCDTGLLTFARYTSHLTNQENGLGDTVFENDLSFRSHSIPAEKAAAPLQSAVRFICGADKLEPAG